MKCEARIHIPGTFRDTKACQKEGKLEHNGKMYCGIHHPPTQQKKRDTRYQAYRDQCKRENAMAAADRKEAVLATRAIAYLRENHPEIVAGWDGAA